MLQSVSELISCIITPTKEQGGLYLSGYEAALNQELL